MNNSTCEVCASPMKPLLFGFYCPKNCDMPVSSGVVATRIDVYGEYLGDYISTQGRKWNIYRVLDDINHSGWLGNTFYAKDTDSDIRKWVNDTFRLNPGIVQPVLETIFRSNQHQTIRYVPLDEGDRVEHPDSVMP